MRSTFIAVIALVALTSATDARIVESWPSAKLADKSDLIVIARIVSTKDAKNSDPPPKGGFQDKLVGVDSTFRVLAVLKGKHEGKQLILFHYRWQPTKVAALQTPDIIDGPGLVTFDPKEERATRFLLFLKKRADGRYECVSGQIDPDVSVAKLDGNHFD